MKKCDDYDERCDQHKLILLEDCLKRGVRKLGSIDVLAEKKAVSKRLSVVGLLQKIERTKSHAEVPEGER